MTDNFFDAGQSEDHLGRLSATEAAPGYGRRQLLLAIAASPLAASPLALGLGNAVAAADEPLLTHEKVPHNAEPLLSELVKSFVTPNEKFFIRSHAPVPKIDLSTFRLQVEGMVERPLSLSLADLQKDFRGEKELATLTCAGNRRSEHSLVKPVKGVPWQAGAIGNAEWFGIRLAEILKRAGVRSQAKHVWFEGVDQIPKSGKIIPFGGSIPLATALSRLPLLAYKMNGATLPPDHGYPLRAVVPGYIGARSVKWLGKIVVSDKTSPNHYLANAYKLVRNGTPAEFAAAPPIYQFAINSVTCVPQRDETVSADGLLTFRGYALPQGIAGNTIQRVEVSLDGRSWTKAKFTSRAASNCWRLWEAKLPAAKGKHVVVVRAIDARGNRQPEKVAWNSKGYLFNAWHRTPFTVN